jgi:hypothetical protein
MQFEGGIFSSFPKIVWKVWAPSKCKFFMWLLLQNRVWTADRLLIRECQNPTFVSFAIETLKQPITYLWSARYHVQFGARWASGAEGLL